MSQSLIQSLLAARELPTNNKPRYLTHIDVLDNIFTSETSGLEAGVYVLGGDAGAGKSTFFLQIMANLAKDGHIAVYCAYEGKPNITGIIRRMELPPIISIVDDTNPGWESSTDQLVQSMHRFAAENKTGKPLVLCIDSVKNLDSGSTQARRKAIKKLHDAVHATGTILFLIAHATKESQGKRNKKLEGPSELAGQADVVLYLINDTPAEKMNKGVRNITLSIAMKNRFGKTGEFYGFALRENGFEWPVSTDAPVVQEQFSLTPVFIEITEPAPKSMDQVVEEMFAASFDM